MAKKLLNPLVVSAFIFVLLLGSIAHLMYGSCQTTKYHYMTQAYWMPEYTPFLLSEEVNGVNWRGLDGRSRTYLDEFTLHYHMIEMPEHHTGEWSTWYENGAPSKAWCFLLGVSPDLEILPSSEELIRASHSPVPSVALI